MAKLQNLELISGKYMQIVGVMSVYTISHKSPNHWMASFISFVDPIFCSLLTMVTAIPDPVICKVFLIEHGIFQMVSKENFPDGPV